MARSAQGSTAAEPSGTERQRARSCALQNNFVVAEARDAQASYRMSVRPRPRRAGLARTCSHLPSAADENAGKFGLRVQVESATRKAHPCAESERDKGTEGL